MSRYENGYLPKIAYHLYKGNEYNVDYFVLRQTKMYGEITDTQKQWIWDEIGRLCEEVNKKYWAELYT